MAREPLCTPEAGAGVGLTLPSVSVSVPVVATASSAMTVFELRHITRHAARSESPPGGLVFPLPLRI